MFTATFPRAATRKLCGAPCRDHRFIPNNILPLISFLNGNQHRKRRLVSRHTELFFAYYVQSPRVTKKWEKQAGSESLSNDALGTSCISVRGNVLSRAIKPHLFHLILRNIKGPLSEAHPHTPSMTIKSIVSDATIIVPPIFSTIYCATMGTFTCKTLTGAL